MAAVPLFRDIKMVAMTSCDNTLLVKNTTTRPQGAPFNQMQRIKELLLYAFLVLKTANVVISRCSLAEDDDTELV